MKMCKLLRGGNEHYNGMPHWQQRNADTNIKGGRKMKKIKSVAAICFMTFKEKIRNN